MRYILFFIGLFFVKLSSAQEGNFASKKKDNCIGVYSGLSIFHNIGLVDNNNTYYSITQSVLIDPLLFFKHKKYEFMGGPILMSNYYGNYFIPGATLSYLYHFSKKRTNLFLEGNIKNTWYTTNIDNRVIPYNKNNPDLGGGFSDAKIMVLAAHVALGFEFKILKFLSGQIAVGPGYYWVNPKPGFQTSSYTNDPYNVNSKDNFYKNHFGFDWYARLGLAWRIYNF